MQSHQDNFGSDTLKNRGHRRSDTLGKSMPITSLLLNYTPSRLQSSENIRSDAGSSGGNISPTQQELPPLYFPIHEPSPPRDVLKLNKSSEQPQDTDEEVEILEQEYEILVSECSSSNAESDRNDDRRKSNPEEYVSLIGNSKFYTPCLTCVGSAPTELATRSSAINEMCRRLCTEECRLRLSLAGLVTPSDTILKNRHLLEEYVKDSLQKIQKESNSTPPKLPPRPINEKKMSSLSEAPSPAIPPLPLPAHEHVTKVIPPLVPLRPPANIAIQRKKFLTDILMQNSNYHNDLLSSDDDDDDEDLNAQQPPKELLDIVTSIVIPPPPPTPSSSVSSASISLTTNPQPNQQEEEDVETSKHIIQVDPHELAMLKDFREKFEIAEALAKTSAMTSTSKMKQRLAARKLEYELENAKAIAAQTKHENETAHASSSGCSHTSRGVDDIYYTRQTGLACNDDGYVQGVPDAVIQTNNLTHKNLDVASPYYDDYEPPRDLLLYLVRMGSFNSAPKINNSDSQDDSLEIPKDLSTPELLQHVKQLRGDQQPPLLTRFFLKPLTSLSAQMISSDITDGLRCLKLNTLSRVCSAPLSDPNHIRLLQWNLLSQTLGQNNDGFVRCPDEALTWENRKFLIVQEILQNAPDIICLQEVDHFKFLQTILGTQNYEGIFFPKPDSPCLYIEENNGPDGCAIFYKRDKFELKNFDTRILEVWRVQSNQVAIAANLMVKATGREICVCTTHLKARHGSLLSKLRNEQGRDLIRFVKQTAGDRAVLLCGDFNAEPIEPVYSTVLNCEFLKLSSAYSDIRAESDECNNESTKEQLDNSDKVLKSIQNEPPYTTWKIREDGEECHTIDYVFYTKEVLKVKNCLEFPHGDEIGKNRTPSFQYPSDHFSLICDFEIIDQPSNTTSSSSSSASSEEEKSKTQ